MFKGIPYYGGKSTHMHWLYPLLPNNKELYVEPFCGGLGSLIFRPACKIEVCNDLNGRIINFWTRVRDEADSVAAVLDGWLYHTEVYNECRKIYASKQLTVESAAALFFLSISSYGGILERNFYCPTVKNKAIYLRQITERLRDAAKRLSRVMFYSENALFFMRRILDRESDVGLLYADPPYLNANQAYSEQMPEDTHAEFLDLCNSFVAKGWRVAISGYHHPLYDEKLKDWYVHEQRVLEGGSSGGLGERKEVLWRSGEWEREKLLF